MEDKIVIFQRRQEEGDWRALDCEATLCSNGLNEYVELPDDLREFEAVFSEARPDNSFWFKLIQLRSEGRITFETTNGIDWTAEAKNLLDSAWEEGFRYCTVRY